MSDFEDNVVSMLRSEHLRKEADSARLAKLSDDERDLIGRFQKFMDEPTPQGQMYVKNLGLKHPSDLICMGCAYNLNGDPIAAWTCVAIWVALRQPEWRSYLDTLDIPGLTPLKSSEWVPFRSSVMNAFDLPPELTVVELLSPA